jgi:cell fate (sporulation/competence/biofilm development) regulator YlbF (YheA/YmcA/DUF963 family)
VAEGANLGSGLTLQKVPLHKKGESIMQLTDEIRQAAEDLGKRLGAEITVLEYLNLKEQTQQDAEAVELELKYAQLYQKLAERQKSGEMLEGPELDEYYALKRQVQEHVLIAARDIQMEGVKALFADTAQRMTSILGIDYTIFAR